MVPDNSPYHLARIVGAVVNPAGSEQANTSVTIFNISPTTINLQGWKLLDMEEREEPLSGTILPGHAITIELKGDGAKLGKDGGLITLLDERGLKVDGVAYSQKTASVAGRPITF